MPDYNYLKSQLDYWPIVPGNDISNDKIMDIVYNTFDVIISQSKPIMAFEKKYKALYDGATSKRESWLAVLAQRTSVVPAPATQTPVSNPAPTTTVGAGALDNVSPTTHADTPASGGSTSTGTTNVQNNTTTNPAGNTTPSSIPWKKYALYGAGGLLAIGIIVYLARR